MEIARSISLGVPDDGRLETHPSNEVNNWNFRVGFFSKQYARRLEGSSITMSPLRLYTSFAVNFFCRDDNRSVHKSYIKLK